MASCNKHTRNNSADSMASIEPVNLVNPVNPASARSTRSAKSAKSARSAKSAKSAAGSNRLNYQNRSASISVFAAICTCLLAVALIIVQSPLIAFASEQSQLSHVSQIAVNANSDGLQSLEDPPGGSTEPPPAPTTGSVPNVVGQGREAAAAAITGAGFTVAYAADVYHPTIPANSIVSQAPDPGTATLGTTVTLTVSKGPEPPGPPTAEYVTKLILDHNIGDGEYHEVGETEAIPPEKRQININQKGKTAQLEVYYATNLNPYGMYAAGRSDTNLGVIGLTWSSSDQNIATVSPAGLVTPKDNGTVTITVTVNDSTKYQGSPPTHQVIINFDGQAGEYVSNVKIIDQDGNSLSYKDVDTKVFTEENFFFQYYALVTWVNSDGLVVRTEDTRNGGAAAVSSTITWSIGGNQMPATINEVTGRLKTTDIAGNAHVICKVTGGVGGKAVEDYSWFQLDNGKSSFPPSDSLTLEVVYQEFPKNVVQTHTYSYSELLASLPSYTNNYTVIYNATTYGSTRAQGFLFKDLMDLEGVVLEEVFQFVFGTADASNMNDENPDLNPFKITYQQLYGSGTRYYFPNWDIGSKSEAVGVPPMLAYNSNTVRNASEVNPTLALDDGSRFKLVLGSLWGMDTNSSKQIYNIFKVKIVLRGAPPSNPDDGNNNGEDPGGGGSGQYGNGTGGTGTGLDGQAGANAGVGNQQVGSGGADSAAFTETGEGATGAMLGRDSHGFRVYEMMSKAKSQVAELELDNPLAPFTAPVATLSILAGAGFTYGSFIHRRAALLNPPQNPFSAIRAFATALLANLPFKT